jgi:hypothetical protein
MEQMMEYLVANTENTVAKINANLKEMKNSQERPKEEMLAKIVINQERMDDKADTNQE